MSGPDFKRYPSIQNYKRSAVAKLICDVPLTEQWIVTEKIHGASFVFWTNGDDFKAGTRNKFATDFDLGAFHQCGKVVNELKDKIMNLHKSLQCDQIRVFGELFGGSYVGYPQSQKPVQREILYCPKVSFCAFDIMIDGKFTSKLKCIELCQLHQILCVPILFSGNFQEAMEYSYKYFNTPSEAYKWFGLAQITNFPNIREGHVIQPNNVYYSKDNDRVIIKHKNELWNESKQSKECKNEDNFVQALAVGIDKITINRLKNILSHGDLQLTDAPFKFIGPFVTDIMKEMQDVNPKHKHQIQKSLSVEIKSRIHLMLDEVSKE